jgi:hypothetical protein
LLLLVLLRVVVYSMEEAWRVLCYIYNTIQWP